MVDPKPGDIFQPGDLLNNTYRVESILGRGGTSEVYRARNDISGRLTAIKVLKQEFSGDEAFITLMRREEEIREIRHDAIVRYSENHRTPSGLVYLVMDYVEGPALDTLMKDGGMSAPDLIAVCRRVADGLRAAHTRRIIHRDLSPDNIILKGGVPSEAVIIDFGIAKDANPGAQTIVGNEFAGKYAYAAPEQLSGQTDARSDLYALGALLLATFRGKRPEPGANPMEVVRNKQLPLNTEGVPEPLKGLIDRLSHPDPEQRFQSAAEVVAAIDGDPLVEGDRTVIVPRGAGLAATTIPPGGGTLTPRTVAPAMAAAPAPAPAPAPAKAGKGGLLVGAVLGLVVLGGAGAWMAGLFAPAEVAEVADAAPATETAAAADAAEPPALPLADPFALTIEKTAAGLVRANGNVPSDIVAQELATIVAALGGTADLTPASGAIGATWGPDVLAVLAEVAKLDSWRIAVTGDTATVTGVTDDAGVHAAVTAALGADLPGVLQGRAEITLTEAGLTVAAVEAILAEQADCGPLALVDPPAGSFAEDDTITVAGNLTGALKQVELVDALNAVAGSRTVSLRIQLRGIAGCEG
jgi:serine/threonine-protein kinase